MKTTICQQFDLYERHKELSRAFPARQGNHGHSRLHRPRSLGLFLLHCLEVSTIEP